MTLEPHDINARAMERYRRGITIELTDDNAMHVTRNGVHTVNNIEELAHALFTIGARNKTVRDIIGPLPQGITWREFIEKMKDEIS